MSQIALQLQLSAETPVALGDAVLFDTILYAEGNILYEPMTGTITLQVPGRYVIYWWAATQSGGSGSINFSLSSSVGDQILGNSPSRTGVVVGSGIIDAAEAPVTVSLTNQSAGSVHYPASTPIKANLIVLSGGEESGVRGDSQCFSVAQLGHVVEQLIEFYPTNTMSVFTTFVNSVVGIPNQLFQAPGGEGPSLFILESGGQYHAIPLTAITAIYVGDAAIYNPAITYLDYPDPIPPGCYTDLMTGVQAYLPSMASVIILLGYTLQASGAVYLNEPGLLVLSDEGGNTPLFIPVPPIQRIITDPTPELRRGEGVSIGFISPESSDTLGN